MNIIQNIYSVIRRRPSLKGFRHLTMAGCIMALLSACSDKAVEEPQPEPTPEKDVLYFAISVSTPADNSTRSTTKPDGSSSDDTLEGLNNESTITKAHVYFFDAETQGNPLLLSFTAENSSSSSDSELKSFGSNVTEIYAKIDLKDGDILNNVKKLLEASEANVYVIANADITQTTINKESDLQEATFSASTSNFVKPFRASDGTNGIICPMSNKGMFTITLPHKSISGTDATEVIKAALELFTGSYRTPAGDPAHLWNISNTHGFLPLERSIARVDYANDGTNNPVFELENALGPNYEDVELELIGMQLFNISKSAFMFRHTSDGDLENGTRTGVTPKIFGNENGGEDNGNYRWIYDCDWDSKVESGIKTDGLAIKTSGYFLNQSTTTTNGTDDTPIWSIAANGSDGYISYSDLYDYASVSASNNGYVPWHYVMENTMPSTEMMGIPYSTGVAFKMKLHLYEAPAEEGGETTDTPSVEEEGETTVTRTEVTKYDEDNCPKVMMKDGTYQYPQWDSEGGYWYFTYRYLIEHNNENDGKISGNTGVESSLAPMQIGVVRNNIYQLKINSISNLPQPHEPDNLYMAVSIHILDWVKRSQSYDL